MNNLKAISLSFNDAPLAIREKVVLGEDSIKRILELFRNMADIQEALILSTCNRTEIYYASDHDIHTEILQVLKVVLGDEVSEAIPYFRNHHDYDAVIKRLFEVSIGLHSLVIGDMQITNQVKKAYQWSVDQNMAGPQLHRLLHTVFFTNKRVVQETPFRDGAASVSYAAKELAELVAEQIENPVVLVVGVGEIGRDFIGNIAGTTARVVVSNRTASKAEHVSKEYGFEYLPFSEVVEFARNEADIIVSSIQRKDPLFTVDNILKEELFKQKCFIDLSVPRSVDPAFSDQSGIILYTIDELKMKADESQKKRLDARPKVIEIIDQEIVSYNDWARDMIVSPTIKKLKGALEQIRSEELERYLKNATKEEAKLVDKVTKSMMQKIIKLPVLNLKAACRRGEAETLIDVLNDLFNLEKEVEENSQDSH